MTPARPTIAALAALAFLATCCTHEVAGHAAACLAAGGSVTRLTSVSFACRGGGVAVDLAGPAANLALAGLGLRLARGRGAGVRGALALLCACNLFWVAGCLLASAVAMQSDFAYATRLAGPGAVPVRVLLGMAAIGLGVTGCRLLRALRWPRRAWWLAYGVAATVACGTALCFHGPALPALRDAALEGFGALAWLLLVESSATASPASARPRP